MNVGFLKRQAKGLINRLGYDIRRRPRIAPERAVSHGSERRPMSGVLRSAIPDVDIFQYAERESEHVTRFITKLENRTYQFRDFSCEICKAGTFTPVAQSVEGFSWGLCEGCGLLQLHRRLRDGDVDSFYDSGEYQAICMANLDDQRHFDLEKEVMSLVFVEVFRALKLVPHETSVVEIGCGSGGILAALKEWGALRVKGYDFDSHRIEYGKSRIEEIEVGDALSMGREVVTGFNTILLSNVLEHLTKPMAFLRTLSSLVDAGGVQVVIDVPNLEYSYCYSDDAFEKFLHIGHLWYFSSLTLERLLNQAGLGVDFIFPRGAGVTVVCSKKPDMPVNNNNGFWNSVSAINYSMHHCDPGNVSVVAKQRMQELARRAQV